jgi:hypothetical protein
MRLFFSLLFALVAVGCAAPLTAAVVTVNTSHDAIVKTHDTLEQIDASDQKACVDAATTQEIGETCLAATRAKYAPAWAAYVKVRLAWLIAYAAVNTAVNLDSWGRTRPDLSSMLSALEGLGDAWGEFSSLIGRKP